MNEQTVTRGVDVILKESGFVLKKEAKQVTGKFVYRCYKQDSRIKNEGKLTIPWLSQNTDL